MDNKGISFSTLTFDLLIAEFKAREKTLVLGALFFKALDSYYLQKQVGGETKNRAIAFIPVNKASSFGMKWERDAPRVPSGEQWEYSKAGWMGLGASGKGLELGSV